MDRDPVSAAKPLVLALWLLSSWLFDADLGHHQINEDSGLRETSDRCELEHVGADVDDGNFLSATPLRANV